MGIARSESRQIDFVYRVVCDVSIEIRAAVEPDLVFRDEPADRGIVVSGSVVHQAGFGIQLASSKAIRI